ncbi:MAG: glycosyltransferase family 39 protein [Lentisphaeria bacterium]|nr:glycosyltransferase family 39 protein [Lentisphaeria bacterium]
MMNHSRKVLSVVIPVTFPEQNTTALLDQILSTRIPVSMELILVNTAAPDHPLSLCREWVDQNRSGTPYALKLLSPAEGGTGAAVRSGIQASTGDVILIQDADPAYRPEDFTWCISPILHGECQVVYGSRMAENRGRGIFSDLRTGWINLLYNSELTDEPAGCRAFDGPLLRSIPLSGGNFDWKLEITTALLRLGFEIHEVPLSCGKISQGQKITWRNGLSVLRTTLCRRFAPIQDLRRKTGSVSAYFQEIIRKRRINTFAMVVVFMIAFLIRLLTALPALSSPSLLMRPDSAPFLAAAGPGLFTAAPSFHKPYPSAWRKWPPNTPEFRKIYGSGTCPPLYPLWLSFLFGICGGRSLPFAAAAGCLLGALACVPVMLAGRLYGSDRVGIAAGLLLALNPTAIAFSPLFLPDTLLLLTTSLQVWFFLRFVKNNFTLNWIAAVILAVCGTLIQSDHAFWILPGAAMLLFLRKIPFCLRIRCILTGLLLFGVLLSPWLLWSKQAGIGWRIDTFGSENRLKNTAALEAEAAGKKKSDIAAEYRAGLYERYAADPDRFSTLEAQLKEQDRFLFEKIRRRPFRYILQHFNPAVLRQDLSGIFINLGIFSRPSQFYIKLLYTATVLLYMITGLGLGWYFIAAADSKSLLAVLLFLLLAVFYLVLPGSTASPRDQLSALPFISLAAACGLVYFYGIVKEKKTPDCLLRQNR